MNGTPAPSGFAPVVASGRGIASEHGGIVTGWILKLFLGLVVFGLLVYEAGAVVVTRVTVDQTAAEAATEAATEYGSNDDSRRAARIARKVAARNGAEFVDLRKVPGRELIEVTVRKAAPTILLDRIDFLERFARAEATKRGVIR